MDIKSRIEQNLVITFLSVLLTGFLAGIATYNGIQEMAELNMVSEIEIERFKTLEDSLIQKQRQVEEYREELNWLKSDYSTLVENNIQQKNSMLYNSISPLDIFIIYTTEYSTEAVEIQHRLPALGATTTLYHLQNYALDDTKEKRIEYTSHHDIERVVAIKKVIGDLGQFNLQRIDMDSMPDPVVPRESLADIIRIFRGNNPSHDTNTVYGAQNEDDGDTGIGSIPIKDNVITSRSFPSKEREVYIWLMPDPISFR